MKTTYRAARVLAPVLAVTLLLPNWLRAQEDAEKGWTMLFDGKGLTGWQFYFGNAGAENEGTFTVQDGVLICSGKPAGYMVPKKSYAN